MQFYFLLSSPHFFFPCFSDFISQFFYSYSPFFSSVFLLIFKASFFFSSRLYFLFSRIMHFSFLSVFCSYFRPICVQCENNGFNPANFNIKHKHSTTKLQHIFFTIHKTYLYGSRGWIIWEWGIIKERKERINSNHLLRRSE